MSEPLRILFVCARNLWRSPTAEQVYRNDPRVDARSAGVSNSARHQITEGDLAWADLVLVMEREHARRIRKRFPDTELPELESLEIPDEYKFDDPELKNLIRESTEPFLPTPKRNS